MILIADSGSTKTDWILYNNKTEEAQSFHSQGLNPYFVESHEIAKVAEDCFRSIDINEISQLFFYGAGCSSVQSKTIVKNGLASVFRKANIEIEHDLMAAARALLGDRSGVACILGTGSNACLYDGAKIVKEAVSFGYMLGDEGSGNHLGKKLLKAIFNGKAPQEIKNAFIKEYPSLDLSLLLEQLYKTPSPNKFLASFSPFINSHRKNAFIQNMIKSSFQDFLDEFVVDFSADEQLLIGFQGSIAWAYNDLLMDVIEERKMKIGPIIKQPIEKLLEYHLTKYS
jgi:glucosamine kinase